MLMLTSEGSVSVIPENSVIASRIARHANAVRQYLINGDATTLISFRGRAIRSEGAVYEFLTDTRSINRFARAGAVYFLDIYDSEGE
jgi:hypothetical protein